MKSALGVLYDRLAEGDAEGAATMLTADSVLHVPGRSVNTGSYAGRRKILEFVAASARMTEGTLRMQVHHVLDDGEWAVAIVTYTATRTDPPRRLENNLAHVARLESGLVAESWLHSRDQYDVDAFWGSAS
jgi:ketosteroid isomerase-like protein